MMNFFDFLIPQKYRGQKMAIAEKIILDIPQSAQYLTVNPLEDEEEFLGMRQLSDRQQIIYYREDGEDIACQDFENQITTNKLMSELENVLKKLC